MVMYYDQIHLNTINTNTGYGFKNIIIHLKRKNEIL